MSTIKRLEELEKVVSGGERMIMAVAAGEDPATITAIARGVVDGVIQVILIGIQEKIEKIVKSHSSEFANLAKIVHVENDEEKAQIAVQMIKNNQADFLMKGLIGTATFMKAVLNRETGLMAEGELLSHVAVMEAPTYPKLLIISDAAIIPNPTMDEKVQILNYTIKVAHSLGIKMPKASLVSAVEKINFKLQSSIDAAVIKAMAERKQISGAIVDGPLSLDVSLSKKHCKIKGLESPINGEADILIFPNIETANTFYKCVTILSKGISASVTVGASVPIVLSSRADDDDTKFYSIVLAARMASHQKKLKTNK